MSTPTPTNPADQAPLLNPQLAKDLQAYELAQEQYKADCKEIQQLAAALASMKNPMFGVQEVMGAVMNMSGDQISALSSLDSVDTDLRGLLQGAQNAFNGLGNDAPNMGNGKVDPKDVAYGQTILDNITQLENFVKWQQSLGDKSPFDSGTLDNLSSAIQDIKGAFDIKGAPSAWGNPGAMAGDIMTWVNQSNNGSGGGNGGGTYAPQLKAITDGFETTNQTVSALSTTTNTQLQFTTEQYKQYLGIDQSSIQAYLKLTSAMIQNEKTN